MTPTIGFFKAEITFGKRSCSAWSDVHDGILTPLLSCEHCQDLAIIFPKPIFVMKHINRVSEMIGDECGPAAHSTPEVVPAITPSSSTSPRFHVISSMSPSDTCEHFQREFGSGLVTKEALHTMPLKLMAHL